MLQHDPGTQKQPAGHARLKDSMHQFLGARNCTLAMSGCVTCTCLFNLSAALCSLMLSALRALLDVLTLDSESHYNTNIAALEQTKNQPVQADAQGQK